MTHRTEVLGLPALSCMAKGRKDEILAEINDLIDEQLKFLGAKVSHGEATEYVRRKNRIKELL